MTSRTAIALTALLLAGCGGDDPANVPQYGQWEVVRTLDSVSVDGMTFAAEDVPAEFREMEGTESICGEPIYTDRSWQQEDISERTKGQCELESYDYSAAGASLAGTCTIRGNGVEYTPRLHGTSTFAADRLRDVVTMEGTLNLPGDDSPHVMKLIAVQEGRRIGDC